MLIFLNLQVVEFIAGNVLKVAESALKMEESRLQKYNEVVGKGFASDMDSNQVSHESHAEFQSFVHISVYSVLLSITCISYDLLCMHQHAQEKKKMR